MSQIVKSNTKTRVDQNVQKDIPDVKINSHNINDEHFAELLENLSSDEKMMLKEYFDRDTKSIRRSLSNGTANGLVAKGILFNPDSIAPDFAWHFNIQEWAWKKLKKHPKYLR